jgi:segregation and condensation protein B
MTWRELWQSTVTNLRALLGFPAPPPPPSAPPKRKPRALPGPVMPFDPNDQSAQTIDVIPSRTSSHASRAKSPSIRSQKDPVDTTSAQEDAAAPAPMRQRRRDEIPPSQLLAAAMNAAPAYKHETERVQTDLEAHGRDEDLMAANAIPFGPTPLEPDVMDLPGDKDNSPGEPSSETSGETVDGLALTTLLESLLFVAAEPVEPSQLARTLAQPLERIEQGLTQLSDFYQQSHRGLRVQRFKEKVQLVTAPAAAPYIETFLNLDNTTRLSGPALETLAIIAYRQPVTRAQIEAVRGVDCAGVLRSLVQRGLIADVGRAEGMGRPILYGVTELFMQHFGLMEMNELPPLEETEADRLWAATVLEEQEVEGEQAENS